MLAAISLFDLDALPPTLNPTIGAVTKHAANPLLVQDTPWEPRLDNGYPNVVQPGPDNPSWQLFYGDCVKGCGTQILLYANSTDGLTWHKPPLGLFDVGSVREDLKHIGRANNIVLEGGGVGVYRDANADASRRYVAFGPACYTGGTSCGLDFRDGQPRYPTQDLAFSADGLVWSDASALAWPDPQRYDCHNNLFFDGARWVATTRDGFGSGAGRTIGMTTSAGVDLAFNTSVAPTMTLAGAADHQLYSQITFTWRNVYLGIVMVYDAVSKDGRVHCRLAWSTDATAGWRWVDGSGDVGGADFIQLGEQGDFDSHVCFAAASPTFDGSAERVYFMGGNGPHSGDRNSSLGLATLRKDGYASLAGSGVVVTRSVRCTGATLRVTADFADGGSLQLGIADTPGAPAALRPAKSAPLQHNATDVAVDFEGGADWSALVGQEVTLEMRLSDAMLYTVGFA